MNSSFNDVINIYMVIYLDDLLIYINSYKYRANYLEIFLSRLRKTMNFISDSPISNYLKAKQKSLGWNWEWEA